MATNAWQQWFPGSDPDRHGWWRLIRFEQIDAEGKPVGKPQVALTPGNYPRQFPSEEIAQRAAKFLNAEEAEAGAHA